MPFTILIAAGDAPRGVTADVLADHVAAGALRALPTACVLRADAKHLHARMACADLLLTTGASDLTRAAARLATERGVPVVSLAGPPGCEAEERFPFGLASFEPAVHPEAIDVARLRTGLRQGAAHVVEMAQFALQPRTASGPTALAMH